MAKKPEERYGSAIDLLKDIEPFADEEELRSFYEERCDTVSSSVSSESTESDIGTTARRRRIRPSDFAEFSFRRCPPGGGGPHSPTGASLARSAG